MRIIKPLVIVEDDLGMLMPNGLTLAQHMSRKIELFTRKCYKSEGRMTDDSYQTFLRGVFQGKHHTGLPEHRMISVTFITDRGVSHEGVRHRMAAYLQESTRYCDYGDSGVTYILPPWVTPAINCRNSEHFNATWPGWHNFLLRLERNEQDYNEARAGGWTPEQARGHLAHFVKTEYAASLNLGSWWNFCAKRAPATAHPQMRQLAIPLLRYFRQHLPWFFDSVPYQDEEAGVAPHALGMKFFSHKGQQYQEARLVVNPYYNQVEPQEVYPCR
jgi:thymidylate synthase (FAD)